MNDYIKLEFEFLSTDQKEILIALLAAMNYEGFEEEGDLVKAYVTLSDFDDGALQTLVRDYNVSCSISKIENKNWNSIWESQFRPVIIHHPNNGAWVAIRADFHQSITTAAHEIIITPKMSFGTGHHPTTALMIRMMSQLDFGGKKILDFGTGTGILAILCEKLGGSRIVAVDRDDQSISNAAENISSNACKKIHLIKGSSANQNERFDIILANIIKGVILENLFDFANQLIPSGILVLSGLLVQDEEEILRAAQKYNFGLNVKLEAENWICLQMLCGKS
jgi:ribosomal protein L11 methyltransferase